MQRNTLPINIQLFADSAGNEPHAQNPTPPASAGQPAPQQIDYSKIQTMLDGTLAAKEDTALKAYFKQQGLSPDEMEQAISGFKQQKAASQPNVVAMQTQLSQAQQAAAQAKLENRATLTALSMGIDIKTVPYLLKMADLSASVGKDGQISDEALTAAVNKVLEDVPVLKPSTKENGPGFKIGADGTEQDKNTQSDEISRIFGNKN